LKRRAAAGLVMPGHSRSKNGVASARLWPGIHVFFDRGGKGVDGWASLAMIK
jgi:hypothetical protein